MTRTRAGVERLGAILPRVVACGEAGAGGGRLVRVRVVRGKGGREEEVEEELGADAPEFLRTDVPNTGEVSIVALMQVRAVV